MSRLSSIGTSFRNRFSLAYLIASCFSRAARFLKLSKSALVRSKRSQFSSARAARSLSSFNCSGVTVDGSTGSSDSEAAGGAAASGCFSGCALVFFIRVGFRFHNFNSVRIDYPRLRGNPTNRSEAWAWRFADEVKREIGFSGARPAARLWGGRLNEFGRSGRMREICSA